MNVGGGVNMVVVNNVLRSYCSESGIAVFGIIAKIFMLAILPLVSISQGMQLIIGYNYGAKRFLKINEVVITALIAACATGVLGYLSVLLFSPYIALIFTDDANIISRSAEGMRYICMGIPIVSAGILLGAVYQAIGKAFPSIFLTMLRQVIIFLPVALILPHFIGKSGAWLAVAGSDILAVLVASVILIRLYRKFNKQAAV